jgi:hypothetical protein
MPDLGTLQACVADGGLFALIIPPVAIFLLALEIVWLFRVIARELVLRSDLQRVQDLVIEGSLGQAILISDKRANDDTLSICRTAIVAMQSSSTLEATAQRIQEEASTRFRRGGTWRVLLVAFLAAIPAGLAAGSRVYAENVVRTAAAEVAPSDRATLVQEGRMDPAFTCPPQLGLTGSLALLPAGLLVLLIEAERRSSRSRKRAVDRALVLAEMAHRVVSHRVYQQERERARA